MRAVAFSFAAPAVMARVTVCALLIAASCSGCGPTQGPSRGQQVLFVPSIAWVSGPNQWSVQIQGRIFEPAESSPGRQALIDSLARGLGADSSDPLYRGRASHFVSDSVRNALVAVALGDRVVQLGPSDSSGYLFAIVTLTNDQVERLARGGVIAFESLPTPTNPSRFPGSAVLVAEEGVIVVSDIDDTIKETNVNNRDAAKANTFLRPFKPVAGMPEAYRAWKESSGPRVHFHIVSAGPWQFHEPLRQFTKTSGFPDFTWDMRSVDTTDPETLVKELLVADPNRLYEFKVHAIRVLMERFPKRHFVLVGDSGERDPETYATILKEFQGRVDAVFIHNVTGEVENAYRYEKLFTTPDATAKLHLFCQPGEVPRSLADMH
jgi:phosphatidate phosphatase APP1